jgi:Tol biopolymer transport system component
VNTGTAGTPNISADGLSLYFFSERTPGSGGRDLYVATRASSSDEFDAVRELVGLNTPDREHLPRVSADELTLYFVSNRSANAEIWRATRSSRAADFADPQLVPELNSESEDGAVTVSPDGLEAILASNRPGALGGRDLYRATRSRTTEPFSAPEPLVALNSGVDDYDPTLSYDGTELYFVSNRNGSNTEVYRSLRSCP